MSATALEVLRYLLPGILAAWVYYGVTRFEKPPQFERLVQALVFTAIVQALLSGIQLLPRVRIDRGAEFTWSSALALFVGLGVAVAVNGDWIHRVLRRCGISRQTGYPSEWFSAFQREPSWVVLHLAGERRLFGWPHEWPRDNTSGHVAVGYPEWLVGETERIPLTGVDRILIRASDVEMVEFLPELEEGDCDGKQEAG